MRKGFHGLSALVQDVLKADPHNGHLFCFRGRFSDRIKIIWWDGQGAYVFYKHLERGRGFGQAGFSPAGHAARGHGLAYSRGDLTAADHVIECQ